VNRRVVPDDKQMSDLLVDAFDQLRIDDMSRVSDDLVTSTIRMMNTFFL